MTSREESQLRNVHGPYLSHEGLHVVAAVPHHGVDMLQVHLQHVYTLRLDDLGHLRHKGPVLVLIQNFGEPVMNRGVWCILCCTGSWHCTLMVPSCIVQGYGTVHSRYHIVLYRVMALCTHCAIL